MVERQAQPLGKLARIGAASFARAIPEAASSARKRECDVPRSDLCRARFGSCAARAATRGANQKSKNEGGEVEFHGWYL